MPVALLLALAASLGLHVAALLLPEVDLNPQPPARPLLAELRRQPALQPSVPVAAPTTRPERSAKPDASRDHRPTTAKPARRPPPSRTSEAQEVRNDAQRPLDEPTADVGTPPGAAEPSPMEEPVRPEADATAPPAAAPAAVEPDVVRRLPDRGRIEYRVDRGDSNFAIGVARQEWEIADGRYRLRSLVETTGLAWLIKSLRIEMESRGQLTDAGLRPDTFTIRRNGEEARERAAFDWQSMQVSVADHAPQPLDAGAQDLLSFNYQLSFMAHPELGTVLHLATGKKYDSYVLEVVGDEEITVPAGTMRTLHLRAPGTNTTELWLAYEYLLLPVKIRHVDAKGDSLVQVATKIQVSPD